LLGLSSGSAFIWLVIGYLIRPSLPLSNLILAVLLGLIAAVVACLVLGIIFLSAQAYNVANPGGEYWRMIFLVEEIIFSWLCFLPTANYGALGFTFSVLTSIVVTLLSHLDGSPHSLAKLLDPQATSNHQTCILGKSRTQVTSC
jgi:hypothetical protein